MKKILTLSVMTMGALLSTAVYADDMKVGVVDVRQALQGSPQVIAIQKQLQQEFAGRNKQMQDAQQQFQQDAGKLNRDSAVMSQADRDALAKKVQAEQQALQNMQIGFQKDLYAKQNEQMQKIIDQMKTAVAKVAQKDNLNLVIAKDAVAYAKDELDITKQVSEAMK